MSAEGVATSRCWRVLLRGLAIAVAALAVLVPARPVRGDGPDPRREAVELAWGRAAEQRHNGVLGQARAEADRLRYEVFPLEDRVEFAGRPRLTLARFLPEIFEGDPWRSGWPSTPDEGTHERTHFLNRHGAKLTADLWGPPMRQCTGPLSCPGVIIVEGGAGASARMYWWAAQALAAAGYVVLTFDVQGQGESETFGHDGSGRIACRHPSGGSTDFEVMRETGPCGGLPSEQPANFTWAAEEAYDWFVSDANPWRERLDPSRIGAAGHSWGATAVSTLQARRPVAAVVGWDWLTVCPVDVPDHGMACPAPAAEWIPPKAPALDIEGDFLYWPLPPTGTAAGERLEAFGHWSAAGVDAMTVVLRGGTHYDFTSMPVGLPASRDGQAITARLTRLWFDRYLRGDVAAAGALVAPRLAVQRWDPVGNVTTIELDRTAILSRLYASAP